MTKKSKQLNLTPSKIFSPENWVDDFQGTRVPSLATSRAEGVLVHRFFKNIKTRILMCDGLSKECEGIGMTQQGPLVSGSQDCSSRLAGPHRREWTRSLGWRTWDLSIGMKMTGIRTWSWSLVRMEAGRVTWCLGSGLTEYMGEL